MTTRTAYAVFKNIESDRCSIQEKGEAICEVLQMPTHNGITKDEMLAVVKFLLERSFLTAWQSAAENPPDEMQEVFVCTLSKNGSRNVDKGYLLNGRWVHRGTAEVTHWMPIPELPGVSE